MHIDAVDGTRSGEITQAIQRWTNKRGSAVSVIDKLPLCQNGRAVLLAALCERGKLTFNRVRGCLLFAGNPRKSRLE